MIKSHLLSVGIPDRPLFRKPALNSVKVVSQWFHYNSFAALTGNPALNSEKVMKPNFDGQKVKMRTQKKTFPESILTFALCEKQGPARSNLAPSLWLPLYFTAGYRGSPPCTLSQYPDNRETGYSNLLFIAHLQGQYHTISYHQYSIS